MFSSDLDRIQHPVSTRIWGIGLATFITLTVPVMLISARTIPYLYAAFVFAFVAAAAMRGKLGETFSSTSPIPVFLWAFLLYATLSAAWAVDPQLTLLKTLLALSIALGAWVLANLFAHEKHANLLHMAEGLWIGFAVGLSYFLIELLTDQSIKIWLFNALGLGPQDVTPAHFYKWANGELVFIEPQDLTRNAASIAPFLWPVIMAVQGTLAGKWRLLGSGAIFLLAGAVVMLSLHESSKLALAAGLMVFCLSLVSVRQTARLVAIAWVCACVAILPAALLAYRFNLQHASWMQESARYRIIIWNRTAEQVLKAPVFGIGASSTYAMAPKSNRTKKRHRKRDFERNAARHAHNIYLQTWYELGLVGATLLTLIGLSIVQQIKRLRQDLQPYGYATFASAAAVASTSYGMWQIWFMAMFGVCAALFALGRNLIETNPAQAKP